MIINQKKYKKIFQVHNPEELKENEMIDLLLCGTDNWNYFFSNKERFNTNIDYTEEKDVEFLEFSDEKDMLEFWNNLKKEKQLTWSTEFDSPCLIKLL